MPRRYLPIQEKYRMPGPTYRLGEPHAGDLRIEVDEERDEYLRAKRSSSGYWASADIQAQFNARLSEWLATTVERDQPGLLGRPLDLDQMIAGIQEDVVFMHRTTGLPASRAKAIYVNVAFPSAWCPQCTAGKGFLSIHAPVPVHDDFNQIGRRDAADYLFGSEDKVRFVWTLAPDTALDRRQCKFDHGTADLSWRGATRAWLRVERQVIAPIDADTACFFIRIYRYDLETVDNDIRESIRSSLLSMPEEVRTYKGFANDFERILTLV